MNVLELGLASLFVLGGLRSLWTWSRRGFAGTDAVDHLLYAVHLTGKVGLWFAFAGFFALYASSDAQGRAAIDELARFRWYALVPMSLAAMQLVAGVLLSRRGER